MENEEGKMPEGFIKFKQSANSVYASNGPNQERFAAELLAEMAEALEEVYEKQYDFDQFEHIEDVLKKWREWK